MWLEKQRKYPKNICSRLMLAILLLASVITLTACRSSNIKETTKQTDHKTKKWEPLVITKREKAQAQKEVKQISDICQNIKINENKVTKKDLQTLYDTLTSKGYPVAQIGDVEDVWTGRNTDAAMQRVTPEMMEENRKHIKAGNPSKLPGDKWGIAKITNIVHVPNMKTDANNQHGVFVSTDLPEENWPWPTSSWEWRDKFAQRLREYTEGLFWFAQNDPELPAHFRKAAKEWGLSKDEYADNGHFPRQVYVREGRRFEGAYFFTANDAIPVTIGSRPPIHESSITASHYALDSHAVRKREKGRVHLDGFLSYPSAVYTVPYGVMVPKEVDNLLLPVPVSGSHIGFSTLRMEPCWMAMGQAAGIASALSIDGKVKVQNIDLSRLQDKLIDQKATLMYFKDVDYTSPHFRMVQYLGLRGYLPEWTARLQEPVDATTLAAWKKLSGTDLPGIEAGKTTRLATLEMIYRKIK
mgnify:CR=1 FL=1